MAGRPLSGGQPGGRRLVLRCGGPTGLFPPFSVWRIGGRGWPLAGTEPTEGDYPNNIRTSGWPVMRSGWGIGRLVVAARLAMGCGAPDVMCWRLMRGVMG